MHITRSTRDDCLVVTLTGSITLATAPLVEQTLLDDLAERPVAVICDLGDVDALDPRCASVFVAVADHPTRRWPAGSLLLCGAQPAVAEVLGGLDAGGFVPLYGSLEQALSRASVRPSPLREELLLAPTLTAPAVARRFVRETVRSWGLAAPEGQLSEPAQLLADELVTNALVHAGGDMRLQLELREDLLYIGVRDLSPRGVRQLPAGPGSESGRGLLVVARVAKAWGVQPHPRGGKVLWCTLRTSRAGASRRAGLGPFSILDSTSAPHVRRQRMVPRPDLLERLVAADGVPLISLRAPPGYGKTALLTQWVERDPRPVVWLSVDQHDNDPAVLLSHLAVALDRVGLLDHRVFAGLSSPGTSVVAAVAPRLGAALDAAAGPLLLVLDDVHLLHSQQSLDALMMLVDQLGTGSQLAVAGRGEPPLPVARLRAQGRMIELGPELLAMDRLEAGALLDAAEVELPAAAIAELVTRTEGWPVALYLAASSLRLTGSKVRAAAVLERSGRPVLEYLRSVLSELPATTVRFLTCTAVLDRMSGSLCDAVLERTGSAEVLAFLERSDLLVTPLDHQRQWYRYHPLLRQLLRSELERDEPGLIGPLARRASAWCESYGLIEASVDYAVQAGDADLVARLLGDVGFGVYRSGGSTIVRRWLAWFEDNGPIERYPAVAALGAWVYALSGHTASAERWADTAVRCSTAGTPPASGVSIEAWNALLAAAMCRSGVEELHRDAKLACELVPSGSPWRATALVLYGMAYLAVGDRHGADGQLARAVELAEDSRATGAAALALAERAVLAIDQEEWSQARLMTEQARTVVRDARLEDDVTSLLSYAAAARLAAHEGEVRKARAELAHARQLRPHLTVALPFYAVQARLELVRAYLALTNVPEARTVLREVDELLLRRPHLGVLGQQAAELRARIDTMHVDMSGTALTAAELRLLPLLATHLTFHEIAERLQVSSSTIKTQAISTYRKLGASSRSQAIERAQALGVLPA